MKLFRRLVLPAKWVVVLVCCLSLISITPICAQADTLQDDTINMVAKTLQRLGENDLAKRFLDDYYNNEKVFIGYVKGGNAETGPPTRLSTEISDNQMTLNNNILENGNKKRIWNQRPYDYTMTTISWAATVYHEYVHMGQKDPQCDQPKDEDPAWQATDKVLVTWYDRLANEFEEIKNEPPSQQKEDKLKEIKDILEHLKNECNTMNADVNDRVKDGILSGGLTWEYPALKSRINDTIKEIEDEIAQNETVSHPASTGAGWQLQSTEEYDVKEIKDTEAYFNNKFNIKVGSSSGGFSRPGGSVSFNNTWTSPPLTIEPGAKVTINVTLSNSYTDNGADLYINNFFGVRVNNSGFLNDGISNAGFAHTCPKTVSGKTEFEVPTGKAGDVLDIHVNSFFSGASGNIKYHYVYSEATSSTGGSAVNNQTSTSNSSGDISLYVNDKRLNLDVPPTVINGRTLVPVRAITDALGATLEWDPQNKVIVITTSYKTIVLQIDRPIAMVDLNQVDLDVPATIINGRTLVPARFIGEAFGLGVHWDSANKRIDISAD